MVGINVKTLETGDQYMKVHYSADPDKNEEWAASERKTYPIRQWNQQMEMSEDVYEGEAVYADYVDDFHCPFRFRNEPIPVIDGSPFYIGGWDCGQTLSPAFVLLQVAPNPFQVHALLEVTSDGAESMEKFAPRVIREISKRLPGCWANVKHVGDATVVQRAGTDGRTAQEVARKIIGTNIKPMTNVWQPRYSAVTWLLWDKLDEGKARFLIDGVNCPVLRKGFQGAYEFEISSSGDQTGHGRVILNPLKNNYSHVHDALQYAAMEAQKNITGANSARVYKRR